MPQPVLTYTETRDFEKTDAIKRRILELYRRDVTKFAKGYESKVLSIFDGIPAQLSRHEKKYSLASIQKEARFREYEGAFIWLDDECYGMDILDKVPTMTDNRVSVGSGTVKRGITAFLFFPQQQIILKAGAEPAAIFEPRKVGTHRAADEDILFKIHR